MKRTFASVVVALAVLMLAIPGCKGRENATGGEPTETIAPATPQPEATGTEAMTQTVDIGTGRSESEGGALTAGSATDTIDTASVTATDTTATQTAAPPTTTTR